MKQPVPLSTKNLHGGIALINTIFIYKRDQRVARKNLVGSLSQENHDRWYWVISDTNSKVAGVTGLYLDHKRSDTVWLGWFGVHPDYRRRGIGSSLLEFSITEAKRRGFMIMKIYTSTDENERGAHKLYESFGFKKTIFLKDIKIVYYSKHL